MSFPFNQFNKIKSQKRKHKLTLLQKWSFSHSVLLLLRVSFKNRDEQKSYAFHFIENQNLTHSSINCSLLYCAESRHLF